MTRLMFRMAGRASQCVAEESCRMRRLVISIRFGRNLIHRPMTHLERKARIQDIHVISSNNHLTRRSLLTGAATLAASAPIVAANAMSIARLNEVKWTRTCDVLVIGFGGSGGPAAAAAKEAGANVLVLEKMPVGGGNATVSSGGFMVPDNPEDGYTYLRQTYQFSGDECDEELLRIFCKESQSIKP